jgi:putative hydrolase of the HAD superfamily
MVRAAIFDRDGVLTHFDVPMLRAFFEPLVPLGLDELAARWQAWCEMGTSPRRLAEETAFWGVFWDRLASELQLSAGARERLRAFDYTTSLRAFPEARAALQEARSHGLKIGVLSNFPLASLDASLRSVGLSPLVDVACSASMIGASKPTASSYLAVTRELGVHPTECIFFDDEAPCVEGACNLGLKGYLVDRTREGHALAERIVRDLDALREIIASASANEARLSPTVRE